MYCTLCIIWLKAAVRGVFVQETAIACSLSSCLKFCCSSLFLKTASNLDVGLSVIRGVLQNQTPAVKQFFHKVWPQSLSASRNVTERSNEFVQRDIALSTQCAVPQVSTGRLTVSGSLSLKQRHWRDLHQACPLQSCTACDGMSQA